MRISARARTAVEILLCAIAGIVILPVLPSLPTPSTPQLGLPVPTPSVPSLLPTPLPTSVALPVSTPQVGAPANTQGGSSQGASTAPSSASHGGQNPPQGIPIPLIGVYVSSPLDVALIGALATLPLLIAIWVFLFLRTVDQARLARDAKTRLLLAADLGLHPRDLMSMSIKTLFSLREKAAFDELTHVLRRAAGIGVAEKDIARARRHKEPMTVAFVDVDGLDEANRKAGRAGGDAVLRGVVRALKEGLRGDDVVFRYGSDEFVCLLPDTTEKDARVILGEIQTEASKSDIRFAFGVAELTRADDVVSLFARADKDLYEFKANRGEIVQFPAAEAKARAEDGLTTTVS